jgi:hypothetical protein
MHDEMRHPDDLLLLIKTGGEYHICASEEIPSIILEKGKTSSVIVHDNSKWQSWPWTKRARPDFVVTGHFLRDDNGGWCENGEWFAFISGVDYFSFHRDDISIIEIGPEAVVPPMLWRNVDDLVGALRVALNQPLSTHDCGGIVADWLGRYVDEYPERPPMTPEQEKESAEAFKRHILEQLAKTKEDA